MRLAAFAGVVLVACALAACQRNAPPNAFRSDGVRNLAHASLTGPAAESLRVQITAVNHAPAARMVELNHCGMSVVVVQAQPTTSPARRWDSNAWRHPQAGPYDDVCLTYAVLVSVAPGQSVVTYSFSIPVRAVLGDSLPVGRYNVAVGGDANGKGGLPAGAVELRLPGT
jgi:hypothetical protein